MSQKQTTSRTDEAIFILTSEDFSKAIGAAIKAAETHQGKPAGKKQVALNAASKAMSGPRANWGGLKAKAKFASPAARAHASHNFDTTDLDISTYVPLPDTVAYDEFGLHCYALEGEAELRNAFAPVFAKGVSVVQIKLQKTSEGWPGREGDRTLDGPPAFLDRNFAPVSGVNTYDQGLVLEALRFFLDYDPQRFDRPLKYLVSDQSDIGAPVFMNITEIGVIFVSVPWISCFLRAFSRKDGHGWVHESEVYRSYANIRAWFGPSKQALDVDEDIKSDSKQSCLPIYWFLDPKLQAGPDDTDLLYDLVYREYSKHFWENQKDKTQSCLDLLQTIGHRAKEPRQERFPEFVFRQRHLDSTWKADRKTQVGYSAHQAIQKSGGLLSRVGKILRPNETPG